MGLLNNTNTGATTAFEEEEEGGVGGSKGTTASAQTAVASKPAAAAVPSVRGQLSALSHLKNALRVDYNTLAQITAQQGNMVEREGKVNMGDTGLFDLISYQDSWVVAPGDDKAPTETLRFSEDGITCSDGTPVQEHLDFLKHNGYPMAAIRQRTVVVAAVVSAAKTDKFNGELMQFDLSPLSRVQFDRFRANAAYAVEIGKYTAEQVKHVKVSAELATKGNNSFTLLKFAVA